jgi:hypothetical protein
LDRIGGEICSASLLWSVGWFLSKWLMGPGLISMSPPKSKNRRVETMEWGFVWDGIGKYFLFEVA